MRSSALEFVFIVIKDVQNILKTAFMVKDSRIAASFQVVLLEPFLNMKNLTLASESCS